MWTKPHLVKVGLLGDTFSNKNYRIFSNRMWIKTKVDLESKYSLKNNWRPKSSLKLYKWTKTQDEIRQLCLHLSSTLLAYILLHTQPLLVYTFLSLAKDWPPYVCVCTDRQEWQVEARQECQPVKVAFSSLEWKSYELEKKPQWAGEDLHFTYGGYYYWDKLSKTALLQQINPHYGCDTVWNRNNN